MDTRQSTTPPPESATNLAPACYTCGEPTWSASCPNCFAGIPAQRRRVRPARGGYDRPPGDHADDVEVPMPGLLEEPAPEPQESDDQADDVELAPRLGRSPYERMVNRDKLAAVDELLKEQIVKAIAAGHDAPRIFRASDLIQTGHVFDAGGNGEWIVFSESVKSIQPSDFNWTPGPGQAPPAKRYVASPQPAEGQRNCDCPDATHRISSRGGKCKHWLAAVMAANIRRRTGDNTLFAIPDETSAAPVEKAPAPARGRLPDSMRGYQPGISGEMMVKAAPA